MKKEYSSCVKIIGQLPYYTLLARFHFSGAVNFLSWLQIMARTKQSSRRKAQESSNRLHLATFSGNSAMKRQISVTENTDVKKIRDELLAESSKSKCFSWPYISHLESDDICEGTAEDIKELPQNAGKWLLLNNNKDICPSFNMSHHDYCWQVVKSLVRDVSNSGIIAAKYSPPGMWQGIICCYTADYTNRNDVRKAADAIRKAYAYNTDMYYKLKSDSVSTSRDNNLIAMYKHTTKNELCVKQFPGDSKWFLVPTNDDQNLVEEEILPSKVSSHKWLYAKPSLDNTDALNVELVDDIEDLPDTAGKWLLFQNARDLCPHAGISHHDVAWQKIKPLVINCLNTKILAAKCSTSQNSSFGDSINGVICCYTADFNNKTDVKKAADEIRKFLPYYNDIYYKTEEDSNSEVYSFLGDRQVSIYKNSITEPPGDNSLLFEREFHKRGRGTWKLLDV